MKTITPSVYTNYRHNAYDSLASSWGVIMGLGGSGNAFTETCGHENGNGRSCDYCDVVRAWNGNGSFDVEYMLQNLDTDTDTLETLVNEGGEHTEYWGNSPVTVTFTPGRKYTAITVSGIGHRRKLYRRILK